MLRLGAWVLPPLLLCAACGEEASAHVQELQRALADAGQDIDRAATAMGATMFESREELEALLKQRVDEVEQELARYRDKAEALSDEARAEAEARAARIERQLADAKAKVRELSDSGDRAWDRVRDGAIESWKVMKKSMNEAVSELR